MVKLLHKWLPCSIVMLLSASSVSYGLQPVWDSQELDNTVSVAWGDYDNDGDLDILVGNDVNYNNRVYKNNGSNNFTLFWTASENDSCAGICWGDYNNDGRLDILAGNYGGPDRVYRNDVTTFTLVWSSTSNPTDYTWAVSWGDFDCDGNLDILTANDGGPNRVYRNDGDDVFTQFWSSQKSDNSNGAAWADFDNDGDLDILIGNYAGGGIPRCRVYRNDISTFTLIWNSPNTTDTVYGVGCADYDNDGRIDFAVANYGEPTRIYHNDGGNSFSVFWNSPESNNALALSWGEYNNDGKFDIVVANDGQSNRSYRNDTSTFTLVWSSTEADNTCSVAYGDSDGDNDTDITIGNYSTSQPNRVYISTDVTNAQPQSPSSGFSHDYDVDSKKLILNWGDGSDSESTDPNALYYAVKVGTQTGGQEIMSGVYGSPLLGNCLRSRTLSSTNRLILRNISSDSTYYWSVSTIDTALKASAWSDEQIVNLHIVPSAIEDLSAAPSYRKVTMTWTSPGDDGTVGDIANGAYEIRCSTIAAINSETDWDNVLSGYPYRISWSTNTSPGDSQMRIITGLTNGVVYYFAMKTRDEVLTNWSDLDLVKPSATPFDTLPEVFDLVSPPDNSIQSTSTPKFVWDETTDPDPGDTVTYEIRYSTDSLFSVYSSSAGLSVSTYTPIVALTENATYWWKIGAKDDDNNYRWSTSIRVIRINVIDENPNMFSLVSPQNNSIESTSTPKFVWEEAVDPDPGDTVTYEIRYSTDSLFSVYSSSAGLSVSIYTPIVALTENATYWWKVKALDNDGLYIWSSTWTFGVNTQDSEPGSFNLVSPGNESILDTSKPTLLWEEAVDPDPGDTVSYTLHYSTDAFFTPETAVPGISTNSYTFATDLELKTYWWKVVAQGSGGKSRPSTQTDWWFRVADTDVPTAVVQIDAADTPFDEGGSVTVSWTYSPPQDLKGYNVYYATSAFDNTSQAAYYSSSPTDPDRKFCIVSGLVKSQEYYFAVAPVDILDNYEPVIFSTGPVYPVNNKVNTVDSDCTIVAGFDLNTRVVIPKGTNNGTYINIVRPGQDKKSSIGSADIKASQNPRILSDTVDWLKHTTVEVQSNVELERNITLYLHHMAELKEDVERKLRIFRLDEDNTKWVELCTGHTVDTQSHLVSCKLSQLSVFRLLGAEPVEDFSNTIVGPNPFKPNDGKSSTGQWEQGIIFDQIPEGTTIKVFTITGELVTELEETDRGNRYIWYAKNLKDRELASGVYIYLLENENAGKKFGKLAIEK